MESWFNITSFDLVSSKRIRPVENHDLNAFLLACFHDKAQCTYICI